jgi:hypothetical protein
MALSNTYSPTPQPVLGQGSSVGNREDLKDVLTILAPEETPVLSSANKIKANSTFVETLVDKLDAPSTDGVSEGADVTAFADKFAARARLGNYVQKFRKPFQVSDLQQAVDSAGPARLAQSEAKAIREIKRDMEATLISDNDRAAEDGAGQPYQLRGLGNWIQSGANPSDVPADYRTPAESIHSTGTFNETVLLNLITSMYRVTGNVNNTTLLADTALRRAVSDFARFGVDGSTTNAGVRNVNYNGMVATIKLSVNLFESDHGIISITNMNPDCSPDPTNRARGYLLNMSLFSIGELIPLGSTRTPNFGGGDRGFVDGTITLCMKHPGGFGKITTLS